METVSTSSQSLQEASSIHEFFNLVATETLALFEHLECEFLTEDDDRDAPDRQNIINRIIGGGPTAG
jgi:hypothetical protein